MSSNIFDRFSFLFLILVAALLPIFCLPFTNVPIEISKGLIVVGGLALGVIFWAIARFFDGKIIIPKSWLLTSFFLIVLATLLSALFSQNPDVSLFGIMFDMGSFWFILAGFVLMFMSSMLFQTEKRAQMLLFGIILSSVILLVFQSVRLFMPEALSLGGMLADKTGNVLGSWNTLGLFAGFSVLMFLLVVEFFPIAKLAKIFLQIFILLSVLLAAAVNLPLVWILLGISSLIIFVYKASISVQNSAEETERKHFPATSLVVVMISLLFLTSGQYISAFIPNFLGISNTEVSPSLPATISITKQIIAENPVFGIGPNRFNEAWAKYKPAAINSTLFWDVSFDSGSGSLPTLTATTGAAGILAWGLFLILFLVSGVKSIFSSIKNGVNWLIVAFFTLSLYLLASLFFYSGGTTIFYLFLVFAGTFIGLSAANSNKEISFSFLNDHRKSFFSILFLIILVILSAVLTFGYMERFASVPYFRKALLATDVGQAEAFIGRALSMNYNDLYLRTYSQVYLLKLSSLVEKGESLTEAEKTDLQTTFDQAVRSAELATQYNLSNYQNFHLLGSVYEAAGTLGVENAYTQALAAYQKASLLNPLNPALKLNMSNAALKDGKTEEALTYAEKALALAPADKNIIEYVNSLRNKISAPPASVPDNSN